MSNSTDDDSIVIRGTPEEDAIKSPCNTIASPANLLTHITVGYSCHAAEDSKTSDKDDCDDTPIAELADKLSTDAANPTESSEKSDSASKETDKSDSASKDSSESKSSTPSPADSDDSSKSSEDSSEQSSEDEAGSESDSKDETPSEDKSDSADESGSEVELGSEETSGDGGSAGEDGGTSDLESEPTSATPKSPFKDPGKMVSRALEYDLQDMYPEITLLFEDKQSAWNCQDPATIRAMWLESRTNILREWKLRNGRIHSKEKPKLEVKPTLTVTLRKQFHQEKAKELDWKEMYIPPGNDAPKHHELALPTNKTTELRYNFIRNNPPVPEAYVLHYEKYRRPPFNIYQPEKCLPPKLIFF